MYTYIMFHRTLTFCNLFLAFFGGDILFKIILLLKETICYKRSKRLPVGYNPIGKVVKIKMAVANPENVYIHLNSWGWSGGAMVLGKLPVPGRPTCLD